VSSQTLLLPLCLIAVTLLGLPAETNKNLHTKASSIAASMLRNNQELPATDGSEGALGSWAEDRKEEFAAASKEAGLFFDSISPYVVATVIFQANTPWSNTVWIDVGKETIDIPFRLKKNCPVVVRDSLVGIVDFVGRHASRVRLLSDPCVRPAVRVVRENDQARHLASSVQEVQNAVSQKPGLLPKPELSAALCKLLDYLLQALPQGNECRLAKGELQGAEYPSSPRILRGVGFNYDFDDEEGSKRDLRTGQRSLNDAKILLIKPGDLLETSGLDGIFPRGLRVSTVASVSPLEEGAISYQILAYIDSQDFPNFEHLTILPAQPEDPLNPPAGTDLIKAVIEDSAR
jgi:rod shape-determining protein MreC